MSKHFNPGGNSTGESAYTGNQKFVYDGSDYTRFKKLQAFNRERGAATAVAPAAASSGITYNINVTVTDPPGGNYGLTGYDRNGAVSGNNQAVNINVGDTITFTLSLGGENHPFYIIVTDGGGVGGANQVANPAAVGTQGLTTGTISWTPDSSAAGNTYYYQCSLHTAMQGQIIVT